MEVRPSPGIITAVRVLLFVQAAITFGIGLLSALAVFLGAVMATMDTGGPGSRGTNLVVLLTVVVAALSVPALAMGFIALRRERWVWYLIVAAECLIIVGNVVATEMGSKTSRMASWEVILSSVLADALPAIVVVLLARPDSRRYYSSTG